MSGGILVPPVPPPIEIRQELGSRYLLDPNEINVMGPFGEIDTAHTLDAGNVGSLSWNRLSGGYSFPWDVRLKRMYAQHYNTNAAAEAWGWVIAKLEVTFDSNATLPAEYILDEVADNGGVGPRDYQDNNRQLTDIVFPDSAANFIPADTQVGMGAAAPTANTTNYYTNIFTGYLLFERVS